MKRWKERDYDPVANDRDVAPLGPLWVEPVAARSTRIRYWLPAFIAVFVVVALAVAAFGRYADFLSAPAGTSAPPAPIAWVDTTVAPQAVASPSDAGPVPGGPTVSHRPALSVAANITSVGVFWYRGSANHFTLELTNPAAGPVSLVPCPTYRMYFTGTDKSAAVLRQLNCAEIGPMLLPHGSIQLDMVFTPAAADPGGTQTLVWEWVTPDTIQAIAAINVFIAQ